MSHHIILGRPIHYQDDVKRLKCKLFEMGYQANSCDIEWALEVYSDSHWEAGWTGLTDNILHEAAEAITKILVPIGESYSE